MRRRTEVAVGAVILLGIAIIFFGTLWLKGGALGREQLVVEASFREVGQLMPGNPVRLRGVPIGRVEGIELERGGKGVSVRMQIRGDVVLPVDPVAILSPQSMFGDWQVEIHPRDRFPKYDYVDSEHPLVLPGYSLPDMSQLTAVADEIAANLAILSGRVELAFTEETALNIRDAIENIQEVSEQLTGLVDSQRQMMAGLTKNLEETTRSVGDAAVTVNRALVQVESAIAGGELANIVTNIHRATQQVEELSDVLLEAGKDFRGTVSAADSTLRTFDNLAKQLTPGVEGTLGRLFQDTLLYKQLVDSNLALQTLLEDIKENPRRYMRFTIF